jgi:hypothetical protein
VRGGGGGLSLFSEKAVESFILAGCLCRARHGGGGVTDLCACAQARLVHGYSSTIDEKQVMGSYMGGV